MAKRIAEVNVNRLPGLAYLPPPTVRLPLTRAAAAIAGVGNQTGAGLPR